MMKARVMVKLLILSFLLLLLCIRYQVMLKCWEEEPRDRPTFVKLKETMKEMERNHKVSSQLYAFI